jgi:predicted amidohydrolase
VENRVYIATANRVGSESNTLGDDLTFTGGSQIVGPKGTYIITFGETERTIKSVSVDPTAADEKSLNQFNTLLAEARPEMYVSRPK